MSMTNAKRSVYRGAKATASSPAPDTRGAKAVRFHKGGTCTRCGHVLRQRLLRHVQKCETLPSAKDIDNMLKDPTCTILKIANSVHTRKKWIINILLFGDSSWTLERLKQHAYTARVISKRAYMKKRAENVTRRHRVANGPQCVCGILVSRIGKLCKWCALESHGIKSYHDMHNV